MDIAELELRVKSLEAEKAARRVKRELDKTATAADRSAARMTGGFKALGAELMRMRTLLAGVGAFMVFRSGIRTIADFQQSMQNARAVIQGITDEDFDKLTKKAREMGATTVFSATEAATAVELMGRAGFKSEEIIASLQDTLTLAAAGGLDMASATDIAAGVLRGFNMEASEMKRVSDVLAMAAASANQTVFDLGDSMKFAAPIAKELNISLEETTAAVSMLAQSNIRGGEAGTTLRMMFRSLLRPTALAKKTLKEYGIEIDQINPELVGLTAALQRLKAAQISQTDAAKIFEARAFTGGAVLTRQADNVKKLWENLKKANGESERQAGVRLDTIQGQWQLLVSAVKEFNLQVGDEGASGAIRSFLKLATDGVQSLNSNWELMKTSFMIAALGMEAGFWGILGVVGQVFSLMKEKWIDTMDWILKKMHEFLNATANLLPDNRFTTDVRGELIQGARGLIGYRAALAGNKDQAIGDRGAAAYEKMKQALEEMKVIINEQAGKALGQAIQESLRGAEEALDSVTQANATANEKMEKKTISTWRKIKDEITASTTEVMRGFQMASASYGDMTQKLNIIGSELNYSMDQHITDGLMGMIDGTKDVKTAFRDMANAIIKDLIRIMIQQLIVRTALRAVGGGIGLTTGGAEAGGVVGGTLANRTVASDAFRGASRFNTGGLTGDEVPIVAHQGEVVFNEDQMAALGQSLAGGPKSKQVEIVNVTDPRMVDDRIAANPDAILNVMTKHRSQFRRVLGVGA